ncbi:hypothetical protein [Bacillus chungangensis]|uniref:Uncharacterized protein n=1 Tax=Bacillus chungangensis TaxID=587633 RepID=A0ABT9WN60_9BACI|nr:hypothetical protein [Bacillus chungangensis]MDQ0174392.1 hypothetical protein [Bacillus chungangensis]
MLNKFVEIYGWLAIGATAYIFIFGGALRFEVPRGIYRLFNTLGNLTIKRRLTSEDYIALARAGYIFEWSLPLLLRWKAKQV